MDKRRKRRLGEKERRVRKALKNALDTFSINMKNNAYSIAIIVYMVFLAIWNVLNPFIVGAYTVEVFMTLVMSAISIPIVILASLIITGKWKNSERNSAADLLLEKKQHELDLKTIEMQHVIDLKNQEIRHLQEMQGEIKSKSDLHRELIFTRELYEHKLRIVALQFNIGWVEANEKLEELDKNVKESIKHQSCVGTTINPGEK